MPAEKNLSYYLSKAKTISNFQSNKKIRVAILSSFTVNGLEETIRVKCAKKNIQCTTYVSGYNQYSQDILKKDGELYKFVPAITFLILDARSIMGNLFYFPYSISVEKRQEYIQKKSDEIINLTNQFTKNSKSKLIITNLCIPTYSPYGIFEAKTDYGLKEMVNGFNLILAKNLAKEHSVYVYDFNGFVTRYGEGNVFDYRQYFYGDIKVSLNYIPYLANDFVGYINAILGLNKKCIVLDLDNTLWGGIVGEDGFEGIKLGDYPVGRAFVEFQKRLLALHQRGIILAINSKNNFDDAIKVIKEHPSMILREENFASIKINWNDKISNFKEIAQELNIGLDSMVFFDDDPVNRELVCKSIPEVLVVDMPKDPADYAQTLLFMNDFEVQKITEEDTKRGKMYLQQRKRIELKNQVSDLQDFLKQLNISVKIKKADDFTIPRISQLTLKTNQFNLTTRRYQEEDIRKLAKDEKKLVGCAQVEDKFGDNGITGVYIVNKDNPQEWMIDTFLLSCRVIGRGVEEGILNHIIEKAKKEGVKKIKGQYIPTKKNKPAENFFPSCGFKKENDVWVYYVDKPIKKPLHLQVVVE